MKKLFFLFAVVAFAACNSNNDTKVDSMSTPDSSKKENLTYAYTAGYSSQFEMGDAKNSQTILNLWKIWDDGDLSKGKDWFADSVEMHISNGMIVKGPRDTVLSGAQSERNMYTAVTSSVDAFMPLRSTDKNENWVCIWGKQISTDKKGKMDSVNLQETWRLNKDGKVDFMLQYAQGATPPKQ
jgi:hypothetical protein